MKNLLLTILCCFGLMSSMQAQKMDFWLDAGLKIQTGFTALYNSSATTANSLTNDQWDFALATGTKYGVKLGMNFNYTGVSLDIMTGKLRGKYQFVDLAGGTLDREDEIEVSVTDIYLLFRNAKHKGYFEIGPKYSIINDVRGSDPVTGETTVLDDFYETGNLAAVLGFGTYILGPEDGRFSGILGFRLEYGFQDIVNDAGRVSDDFGTRQPVNYGGEAGTTNPIFAGIVFELNWGIGGVGQARCGERSKFIWF